MDYDPLAEFYALQYARYTDDLEFYARLARDYGGPVLELGAGTGRVTRAVARLGVEVVALEPSGAMRELGRQHTEGLPVEWLEGDMRALDLGRRFPLIIAPFNAFMHLYTLEEQDQALRGIADHLGPGGRLAFDLYNPAHIGPPEVLRWEGSYEGGLEVFIRQEHLPAIQALLTHYYLDRTDAKGVVRRQTFTLTQRYFTRYELERWLRSYGFDYRLKGGFHGKKLDADSLHFCVTAWRQ